MLAQALSPSVPARRSALNTCDVLFAVIAPFPWKAFAGTGTSWVPASETLSHSRRPLPRPLGVNRPRDSHRQRAIEKSEQELGGRAHAIGRPGNRHGETRGRIHFGTKLDERALRGGVGDLCPASVNARCDARRDSRNNELAWEAHWRAQEWER